MATQAERRAQTRGAILAAAADLFGRQGFAAATMDQIAAASGVAKGAVYHHFPTKEAVFEAVFREASAELARELAASTGARDPLVAIAQGTAAYFAACAEGPRSRIILKDGPAVLGWQRWREIDAEHFGGLIPKILAAGMREGAIRPQPVEPLARLVLGAVNEAAVACAAADDPAATGREYAEALQSLLDGLRPAPAG